MKSRATTPRRLVPFLVLALLLFLASPLRAAERRAPAGGPGIVEMPAQVAAGGMTRAEYAQRQSDLNARLMRDLPPAALAAPLRVGLTAEEVAGVARAPRPSGVPLQVGLVKPLVPRVAVDGLRLGSEARAPRRAGSAPAAPTGDGGFVWALAVATDNAGALRLHVENLSLPANAALYFYSRAGEAFGPYTDRGPDADGDLWTDTIFGSEGILEVRLAGPATEADLRQVRLDVTEAGLVLPQFTGAPGPTPAATGFCGDPACLVDATCYDVAAANPAKDAVAKMEWIQGAFIYSCTGGLISDNNPAQDNFFLTAHHCISKNNSARNVQFYWRFATSSCNGACPTNSGWPFQTMGATVAVSGRKGDFTLLHLNAAPPSGSVFLGWTNSPVANTGGEHLYRISNPDFGPQVYSQHDVDVTAPTCSSWPRGERIYSRDITGAIDGGSSGSPVLNAASQIVGQLSGTCGLSPSDPCASGPGGANATVDGAFAFYYASVQPYLYP